MVESSTLRRLYRILSMPTAPLPDMNQLNQDINCSICLERNTEDIKKPERRYSCFLEERVDLCSCKEYASICMNSVHF